MSGPIYTAAMVAQVGLCLALAACDDGDGGTSGGQRDASVDARPDAAEQDARPPADGAAPPVDANAVPSDGASAACDPAAPGEAPVVALEWDGTSETYFAPGFDGADWSLDYQVYPRPRVERARVELDYDPAAEHDPRVVDALCPEILPFELLRPEGVASEVVAARIIAKAAGCNGSAARSSRSARPRSR